MSPLLFSTHLKCGLRFFKKNIYIYFLKRKLTEVELSLKRASGLLKTSVAATNKDLEVHPDFLPSWGSFLFQ